MEEDEELQTKTKEGKGNPSPNRNTVVLVVIVCILISSSLLIYYWLSIEGEEHWTYSGNYKWRINDDGDWEVRINTQKIARLGDVELWFVIQATGNTSHTILNSSGVILGPITFLNNGNADDLLDYEDTFIISREGVCDGDYLRLLYRPTGGQIAYVIFPIG